MFQKILKGIALCGVVAGLAVPGFGQAPTADQGMSGKTDRQIMQEIRKSIVSDKSLSTYGHNVKVISQHGKVTLRGPVHSEEERRNIEAKAAEVAGQGNVTDMISVKPENQSR